MTLVHMSKLNHRTTVGRAALFFKRAYTKKKKCGLSKSAVLSGLFWEDFSFASLGFALPFSPPVVPVRAQWPGSGGSII